MKRFNGVPVIPANYPRVRVLTEDEIDQARSFAYVAGTSDPRTPARREGADTSLAPYHSYDISDWRIRIYIVWFCYIFQNYNLIHDPRTAICELILEFKAPDIVDLACSRLASLYSGAGISPLSDYERKSDIEYLKPHYEKAIRLEQYARGN